MIDLFTKRYENGHLKWVLSSLIGVMSFGAEVNARELIPAKYFSGVTQQAREVSGTVLDEKGEALIGVSVLLKGTQIGTVTDLDGKFKMPLADGVSGVLQFSFVGYLTQEVTVGNQSLLKITLKPDAKSLEELVVIGYGTTKKSDLSAAVATVPDMARIKDRPVLNVQSMLQGKVAGVTAVSGGGHPNETPAITIRGKGSKGSEDVLYVVDGVPGAPYNPSDVESITVLKDAASAAIYGAFSGSAGVILITTRQATPGKPSVEYSGFTGIKQAWKKPKSLNAQQEAMISNLAYKNAGLQPLDGWDATKNPDAQVTRTNWVDEIFRTAIVQRHNVSVNAGTDKFSTLLQGRYEKEEGTLLNTYNQNLSLRFNANYQFNKHVKFRQDVFWNNNDKRGTATESGYSGTILSAIYMPSAAVPYYADGSFGGVGPRDSNYLGIHGDAISPVGTLMRNRAYDKKNQLQSVSELTVSDIIPDLTFTSRFSYKLGNLLYKNFEPRRTEPGKPSNQNILTYKTQKESHWIWENTLNYNKVLGKHNIGGMLSSTAQVNSLKEFTAGARGFENEENWAQYFINASIYDQDRPTDQNWEDRNTSYVGRLSYSWAGRYFVTGSYRYDIAGRLAAGTRGKGFPGVTGAWKISSEPFFDVPAVDLLKVRASWGRIGNIGSIAKYYGYPKLKSDYSYQVGNGAPYSYGMFIENRFNPNLSWETSQQTNIGLDLNMFKSKLTITADYFDKLTYDLIKQQDTGWTDSFGYGAPYINQGKIRNTGLEFAASWSDRIGDDLTFEVGGNFATLKNRVDEIDGNPNSFWAHTEAWRGILTPYRSVVGQPLYSYWLIQNDGIFKSDAEAAAYTSAGGERIQPNAKAGDLRFIDENKDGKIDDGDRVFKGSAFPKVTYGFTASANWKNFDASIFFQGVGGVKLFHAFKQSTLNGAEQGYNRWDKILDAWSETNMDSDIPKVQASDPNRNFATNSDWYLENGNYLRLKNLVIGYTFKNMPGNSNLRVYVSGDNLLTFTKYSGMDPEVGGIGLDGGQFPVSRVYSVGLKLKF